MDPVMFALLFGFFGICIVWTLAKNYAGRLERGNAPADPEQDRAPEREPRQPLLTDGDPDPELTRAVYRKIGLWRLASLALCLLAIAALYVRLHTAVPLALAVVACGLQWYSYRFRIAYLRTRRLVPQDKH